MNKDLLIVFFVLLLYVSLGVNVYFASKLSPPTRPVTGTLYASIVSPKYPLILGPGTQLGQGMSFAIEENLNGTALVTCSLTANAPVNFYIKNGNTYVFSELNITNLLVNVTVPKGDWAFMISEDGVISNVTSAWIFINYTYFASINKPQ